MPRNRKNKNSKQHISSGVTGVVKAYQRNQCFGFITEHDSGNDVFFHISGVLPQQLNGEEREFNPIRVGDEVEYDLYITPKGYRAESVKVLLAEQDSYGNYFCGSGGLHDWFQGRASEKTQSGNGRSDGSGPNHRQSDDDASRGGIGNRKGQPGGHHRGMWDSKSDGCASDHNNNSAHSQEQPKNYRRGRPEKGTKPEGTATPKRTEDVKPSTTTSSSTNTWSSKHRERGNVFYKSATDEFCAAVRIGRLENSITCYRHALSCSENKDDEASALKNIGMASWKLASIALSRDEDENKDEKIVLKHFKETLKYLCMANALRSYKSASWGEKVEETLETCWQQTDDWLTEMDTPERVAASSELLGYIPDCELKANGYIQYATLLFHEGLSAWQDGEYKECYRYMRECYYPIQEADRLSAEDDYIESEVEVLREDVFIHTCMAESCMARTTGDTLLGEHLRNEETIKTDTIWTVIDFYKQAAVLCRDKDLEQEAIAYSRLGRVYGKVLRLSSRGKDYYKQAIQLALSMTPRTFHGVDWYNESTAFVEEFQRQLHKEENDDSEMKAALQEMEEDVDKLEEMADSQHDDLEFVKLLYKTWPPKTPGAKLNENLSNKKLLLKAVSHYHPDKVDKEVHGKNWFYFSGEITKHLNRRYITYKGCCD